MEHEASGVSIKQETTNASDTQKGLYFIQKTCPQTSAYNLVFSSKIVSGFDCSKDILALEEAIQTIQKRHSILQQVYFESDGDIRLKFTDKAIKINQHDLEHLSSTEQFDVIHNNAQRPFDLQQDICLRIDLFKVSKTESVLLIVAHHASFDFWSLGNFLKELELAYDAVIQGSQAHFKDAFQFSEQLDELGRWKESEEFQQQLSNITDTLDSVSPVLDLKTDFNRPLRNSYSGSSLEFSLPAELVSKIKTLGMEYEVTPYTLLLSAYFIALHRYSGQDDILVGTPVAGRERRKQHQALGNFVNTIVLRSEYSDISSKVFFESTAKTVVQAIKNQKVPFPAVVEALKLKPDPSRSALVQAGFAWDKLPNISNFSHFFNQTELSHSVDWAGLELEPYWMPQQEGQYDIALEMGAEVDGQWCASLKYRDDLFSRKTIQQFANSFVTLLEGIVSDVDKPISHLALSTGEASQSQLASTIDVPTVNTTVPDLIAQVAAKYPELTAVADESSNLSYQELNQQVDTVSRFLSHHYSVKGKRIGVSVKRNKELPLILLAVMKSGAAYVPIEPNLPPERAQMIIDDADLELIINDTSGHHDKKSQVESISVERLLSVEEELLNVEAPVVETEDSAYIIFTSGSTGRPKGVEVSHANVVNMLHSFAVNPGIASNDSLLTVTTISFDISVLEMFLPLSVGAKAIVLDAANTAEPEKLISYIEQFQPTWMQATPATWKMLVDADWQGCESLTSLCGGEPLPRELAEQLNDKVSRLVNVYGPTETTVWSSFSVYQGDKVHIGQPVANTEFHVLDSKMQPVPKGVVGELYISGKGVTKGYFNRQDLTQKAFVHVADKVLYKTGDLGRLSHEGYLECYGRLDSQVKIRGFRIELNDIEENLRQLEGVDDAVVTTQVINDDQALVAYFVTSSEVTVKDLKAQLKARLPHYMVPNYFKQLDALPLNSNGKVDRKSLPTLDLSDFSQREIIKPRNDLEYTLHAIWVEVLNQQYVSIEDDFYDIGGHSLLAIKLIAKLNDKLDLNLDNQFLFSYTTIAAMAEAIESNDFEQDSSISVPLNKGEENVLPLHLLHPIGGTIYCYMALNQYLEKRFPVYAYQSPGIKDADEIEVGIEEIAGRYVDEILEKQPEGPYQLGGWCFGGVLAYEAAHQLKQKGHTVLGIHVFDTRAPIVANHPDDGDDATLLSWFARDLAVPHNKKLDLPPDLLRTIDVEDQFQFVLDKARQIDVVEETTDVEELHNFFQIYIANGMALQMYDEHSYDINVNLYRAQNEPEDYGEVLGWDKLVEDKLTVTDIPGDHNSIMYKPNVELIAAELNQRLSQQKQWINEVS